MCFVRCAYLHRHKDLLLLCGQVVTLSQEDLAKGPLPQLSLQHDVVSLDVLDDWKRRREIDR